VQGWKTTELTIKRKINLRKEQGIKKKWARNEEKRKPPGNVKKNEKGRKPQGDVKKKMKKAVEQHSRPQRKKKNFQEPEKQERKIADRGGHRTTQEPKNQANQRKIPKSKKRDKEEA